MKSVVRAVYLLDGGTLSVEFSAVVPGRDFGRRMVVPVQMFLVETAHGFVMVDTGNDPAVLDDPVRAWGSELVSATEPTMTPQNHPEHQLRLLGLGATDIVAAVYTHLHHDHAGGGKLFHKARHYVQRAEYRWARDPDPAFDGPYVTSDLVAKRSWRLLDGDRLIWPGFQVVATPGHSPGHQSIVLWDVPDNGTIILAGDAINTESCIANDLPPGITTDALTAVQSMRRLTSLATATDGTLITGHDLQRFERMPKIPNPLTRDAREPLDSLS